MKYLDLPHRIAQSAIALMLFTPAAWAGQLSFPTVPSGAGAREPAPNVIVSVDDSGSMGPTGMATLRAALTATFGVSANLADNRIRLAWQSMNRCPQIGVSSAACGTYNGMKYLGGTHRANFDAWARGLVEGGGTPGHLMMDNAGQYLSDNIGSNVNSPWAADPGTTLSPVLSCRKNFHIFMTDGGWNSGTNNTNQHIDTSATNNGARIQRGGNADNTTTVLTTTATYDVTSNQTRLYRDTWGGATTTAGGNATTLSTLADLAFFYWSRDLQPSLTNDVRPSYNRTTTETFVATNGTTTTLDPIWNPRNNPANWQNMVNYTIGFNTAATWAGDPVWGGDTFGGGLPNLINGVDRWQSPFCEANNQVALLPNTGNRPCDGGTGYSSSGASPVVDARRMDLWHAALNSRGLFVPAPNAQALVDAFQTILDDILQQTASQLVSITSNSSRVTTNDYLYLAGFSSESWSGELQAFSINNTTGLPSRSPTWKASALLDARVVDPGAANTRLILTHDGSAGRSFRWANLSTAQRQALTANGADTATVGEARVNYLRGVRTLEERNSGGYLRNRETRLGDLVNSNLWHVGKPERMATNYTGHQSFRTTYYNRRAMLYVGGNDGMLHGFDAQTGAERIAYVPLGVYSKLRAYTAPSYAHAYMVDGSPFTGDADLGGSLGWRTVLVSGLGAGGKGYFILDVSNPQGFTDPGSGTSGLVVMDNTTTTDPDIGHIFATSVVDNETGALSEQIVKLNNGRWAVIMGNGYNSTNEQPVLLIQYLDGTKNLKKIVANSSTSQTNGLGAPRPVDVNGDGTADYVYAGDLKGNIWKFNLTGNDDSRWGVSNWQTSGPNCSNLTTCVPFFQASDSGGKRQPVMGAPLVHPHPKGGMQIVFGTGRDLTAADRTNVDVQTIYGVWDLSFYGTTLTGSTPTMTDERNITNGRSALVQQSVTNTSTSTGIVSTSSNLVVYNRNNTSAPRGWYFDLPYSGQRVVGHPQLFEGLNVLVGSFVPGNSATGETCNLTSSQDSNYITILDMISGAPAATPVFGSSDPGGEGSMISMGTGDITFFKNLRTKQTTGFTPDHFDNNTTPSSCTGPDCSCNGKVCVCTGPNCQCTDPTRCKADPASCGNILPGMIDLCRAGLFGNRTDWRELR
jgi:type IV pilus assembly protein PilY1